MALLKKTNFDKFNIIMQMKKNIKFIKITYKRRNENGTIIFNK